LSIISEESEYGLVHCYFTCEFPNGVEQTDNPEWSGEPVLIVSSAVSNMLDEGLLVPK